MTDKKTAIQQLENTILDCENRTLEIEEKKRDLFNKMKSRPGELSREYIKQLSGLNAEKTILEELADSCRIDLGVLNLLRPIDNKTRASLENRANEIDSFLTANNVSNVFRDSLKTFRNQLMSEARFTARPEPRKVKIHPWD